MWKKVNFNGTIIWAVLMELALVSDMIVTISKKNPTVTGYVINTVISIICVLIYTIGYLKNEKKKDNKVK